MRGLARWSFGSLLLVGSLSSWGATSACAAPPERLASVEKSTRYPYTYYPRVYYPHKVCTAKDLGPQSNLFYRYPTGDQRPKYHKEWIDFQPREASYIKSHYFALDVF